MKPNLDHNGFSRNNSKAHAGLKTTSQESTSRLTMLKTVTDYTNLSKGIMELEIDNEDGIEYSALQAKN